MSRGWWIGATNKPGGFVGLGGAGEDGRLDLGPVAEHPLAKVREAADRAPGPSCGGKDQIRLLFERGNGCEQPQKGGVVSHADRPGLEGGRHAIGFDGSEAPVAFGDDGELWRHAPTLRLRPPAPVRSQRAARADRMGE
jgi:hypothetical protein